MDFVLQNWHYIVVGLIMASVVTVGIVRLVKMSKQQRIETIRGWLLQAVILAERTYGGGTGRLKLSVVYDKFCEKFPWLAKIISFARFAEYVDEVLVEMRELLSQNQSIAAVVTSAESVSA